MTPEDSKAALAAIAAAVPAAKPLHAPKAKTVTAYWTLPALLTAFAAAGWGDLHGREWQGVRSVLHALAAKLNHKTGKGTTTALQLADAAGLSERWTRHCLNELETLGLLTWQRGGIRRRDRIASYFTVNKKALAALVRDARSTATKRYEKRRIEFLQRLSSLQKNRILRGKTLIAPALSASPSPLSGEVFPPTSPDGKKITDHVGETLITKPIPRPSSWVDYCPHEGSPNPQIIHSCPDCRLDSLTDKERAEYDGELLKLERLEAKSLSAAAETEKDKARNYFFSYYYPQLQGATLAKRYIADLKAELIPDFEDWYKRREEAKAAAA